MKKQLYFSFIVVALVVALVVAFVKISDLNGQLKQQEMRHNTQINQLNTEISLIYKNVDEQMKREASLFANTDYEFGSINSGNCVPVSITLTPKQLTDDTVIHINHNGETIMLERAENSFIGNFEVGLFENVSSLEAVVEASGIKKIEYLDDLSLSMLFKKFLPVLSAKMSGNSTYSYNNKEFTIHQELVVNNSKDDFVRYTLVEEVDGEEVGRVDLTDEIIKANGDYSKQFNKNYKSEKGGTIKIHLLAEDNYGYVHRSLVYFWNNDDSPTPDLIFLHEEEIFDKDGNVLFTPKLLG